MAPPDETDRSVPRRKGPAAAAFQVFAKPAGPRCNLACSYCYYLETGRLHPAGGPLRMGDEVLERLIAGIIDAWPDPPVSFSWHGGEPTLLGVDFFRKAVALERRLAPPGRAIANGIQTNGTLLDGEWCRFLKEEGFSVGLSLDGPRDLHDALRRGRDGGSTFDRALRGYRLLLEHGVPCEILCVVSARNVHQPLEVYRFFRDLGASWLTFLPLVERLPGGGVTERTVPPEAFGDFLSTVFDRWIDGDIGRVKVQAFEEAARPALGADHTLCIFKETCGRVPVVERDGSFHSCDHFVDGDHRIGNVLETPLADLLESPAQREFGRAKRDTLPRHCLDCEHLAQCNGECPKNRFALAPGGEPGLNYLCPGYKRFFDRCRPFVEALAAELRRREAPALQERVVPAPPRAGRPGRNDPCPCGSGKKHKRCCGRG